MEKTKRRLKVFLCHAHSDAEAVWDLFRYLRRAGLDVWFDKESLLPGTDWDLEIRRAVRESDVVVVCLSKQFNQAGYRQKEVRIALDAAMEKPEGEIFIIPARLEASDTLESLRKWHWVDLFEEDGRQRLIYALRARAENVGAVLRRRSGERKTASTSQNQGDKNKKRVVSPASFKANTQARQKLGLTNIRPGIWINDDLSVYRDAKKLGFLKSPEAVKLLAYLIAHKGKLCYFVQLYGHVYGSFDTKGLMLVKIAQIESLILNIRNLIEIDANQPSYLVGNSTDGYILKD